jgi:hypothetical protein
MRLALLLRLLLLLILLYTALHCPPLHPVQVQAVVKSASAMTGAMFDLDDQNPLAKAERGMLTAAKAIEEAAARLQARALPFPPTPLSLSLPRSPRHPLIASE